jgi:hypothetical protein
MRIPVAVFVFLWVETKRKIKETFSFFLLELKNDVSLQAVNELQL